MEKTTGRTRNPNRPESAFRTNGRSAAGKNARGYSSPSAFIRAAIRNEIQWREDLVGIEERHQRQL